VRKEKDMPAVLPSPLPRWDRRNGQSREDLVRRVCGEFLEMPCLRLTRGQAQRLFGLRADVCDRLLATLVRKGTLSIDSDSRYRLNDRSWSAQTALGQKVG
jgi:hypothetical protein